LAEADAFLPLPLGRNTTSSAAISPAAATALIPVIQRLRTCRCLVTRCSCWRRYRSLACLRWRSFLPATGRVLLGLSCYLATLGIQGRQANEPVYRRSRNLAGTGSGATPGTPA